MNYSQAKRLARQVYGPAARVSNVNGTFTVYVPDHSARVRTVYGEGHDYVSALMDCFAPHPDDEKSSVLGPSESVSNESLEPNAPST